MAEGLIVQPCKKCHERAGMLMVVIEHGYYVKCVNCAHRTRVFPIDKDAILAWNRGDVANLQQSGEKNV